MSTTSLPDAKVTTYTVTFDRIGRSHDVPPLTTEAADLDELAEKVYRYGRSRLMSRDVEVVIDPDGAGMFLAGFQNGGTFVAEAVRS